MAKYKTKKLLKNVAAIGLTVLLGVGAVFGIMRLIDKEAETHKTITPSYHVGSLNDSGKWTDSDASIYSDVFECQGLIQGIWFCSS